LLGVVIVESFLAMFLLTIIHGLVIRTAGPGNIFSLVIGVVIFILFFVWLSMWLIPRVVRYIERIKNDEIFLLFALGMVFLSAALAEVLFIPAIIGAFFIGMVFADTKLSQRMSTKISPLRDVFVAIFFISFGMMINPAMFPAVIGILIIAVPLIILNDILITSSLAYFVGFSSKGATFLGSSLIGRNEESIFYSAIGTNAINNNPNITHEYGGKLLNPFAGLLCIIMSSLTPTFMRRSDKLSKFFSRALPKFMKFSGNLVARTVKTMVMPSYLPLYKKDKRVLYALILYSIFIVFLIATASILHLILSFLIIPITYLLWKLFAEVFRHPVRNIRFGSFQPPPSQREAIENLVLKVVVGALVAISLVVSIWIYSWLLTIIILLGYFVFVLVAMRNVHQRMAGWRAGIPIPRMAETSTDSPASPKMK